jgi:hypothetical protein
LDSLGDPPIGGSTSWSFTSTPNSVTISKGGQSEAISSASVTLTLTRGVDGPITAPDTFAATFTLVTGAGTVEGTASGEAIRVEGAPTQYVWKLRGVTTFTGGTWNAVSGAGGFSMEVSVGQSGLSDDMATWRLDGLVTGPT